LLTSKNGIQTKYNRNRNANKEYLSSLVNNFSIIIRQKETESKNKGMGDVNYHNKNEVFNVLG